MAARQLQRRLLSLLFASAPHASFRIGPSWQFLPSVNSLFSGANLYRKGLQTLTEPSKEALEHVEKPEISSGKPYSSTTEAAPSPITGGNYSVKDNVASNMKISSRHDLAMIFTCKVCETRNMKTACRESYEKGVVVARCGGCNNLHLIADHLGWFGEPGNIEDLLAARGEEVKRVSVDTLNITLEDLAGKENLKF